MLASLAPSSQTVGILLRSLEAGFAGLRKELSIAGVGFRICHLDMTSFSAINDSGFLHLGSFQSGLGFISFGKSLRHQ